MSSDGFWVASTTPLHFHFVAPLRLPTGALVDGCVVVYDDSNGDGDLVLELYRHWVGGIGATGTEQIGTTFTSSGTPGMRTTWVDLNPDSTIRYAITVSNTVQSYVFKLQLNLTLDLRFRGTVVHWKRQISPAPAVATFADMPLGAFGFQHVEALVDSGITAGCGGGNFCPDQPPTRVQMAIFLSKALGLHWAPQGTCRSRTSDLVADLPSGSCRERAFEAIRPAAPLQARATTRDPAGNATSFSARRRPQLSARPPAARTTARDPSPPSRELRRLAPPPARGGRARSYRQAQPGRPEDLRPSGRGRGHHRAWSRHPRKRSRLT